MKKFRFLDWKVYKDSQILFSDVLVITNKIPRQYKYDLGSQIIRSSFSIILNISEGSDKTSEKELNRFLDISLGSAYETLAAAHTFYKNDIILKKDFDVLYRRISEICDQLGGFKKRVMDTSKC
ncbi:MAG: hypothetical protein COV70_04260 [Parcubacteria group bacterium CG11_big_fil_rev_8_21_14_0_20_39_22]|nr:MAG: hypothetical protein COV70_04260 [Parcubacteria group bacterium CG11_big_fil_rev_8_21_14_0_20_39_22]